MVLDTRNIYKKLPKFLRRLLWFFRMAPEPPDILGLFTDYRTKDPVQINNLRLWYRSHIRKILITRECLVTKICWYKGRKNVRHEFLRFDISSPDKVHTTIVIAERGAGESSKGGDRLPGVTEHTDTTTPPVNPTDSVIGPSTQPVTTTPPLASPDVASDSTASSADETTPNIDRGESAATDGKKKPKAERSSTNASSSSNIISRRLARDAISYATLDSTASAELEQRCKDTDCISTLTFPENAGPSADKIATLLVVTSELEPMYQLMHTQCYWFVATVFEASKRLFPGAEQDITKHKGGKCYRIRIPQKPSVDAVCGEYDKAQTALDAEIEEERRVEREVPVLLFEFAIYTYHNLNSKKKRGNGKLQNSGLQRKGNASNVRLQRKGNASNVRLQRKGNASNVRLQRKGNASNVRLQRKGNASNVRLQRKGNASNAKLQKKPREGNASNAWLQRKPRKGNASNVRQRTNNARLQRKGRGLQKKRLRTCCARWRHRGRAQVPDRPDGRAYASTTPRFLLEHGQWRTQRRG
ncbi:hypothetical protein EDD15DRAFT_1197510 [Pisolithus albus]|nr:hypothetical protein EDD15DRAFT_1197510 [Pisolithus albus]